MRPERLLVNLGHAIELARFQFAGMRYPNLTQLSSPIGHAYATPGIGGDLEARNDRTSTGQAAWNGHDHLRRAAHSWCRDRHRKRCRTVSQRDSPAEESSAQSSP